METFGTDDTAYGVVQGPILPAPVRPTMNDLVDLTQVPDKEHRWADGEGGVPVREWDAGIHSGYYCLDCDEMSECVHCHSGRTAGLAWNDPELEGNQDCLRNGAERINRSWQRNHEAAMRKFEGAMEYYRMLKERYGYR